MQEQGNLIKKGHFYFIYDGALDLVLEDKTKRGLEYGSLSLTKSLAFKQKGESYMT